MCRIVENLVEKERQEAHQEGQQEGRKEAFLRLVKKMWEQNSPLAQMVLFSERSEADVIAALNEMGLSIPN